MQKLDYAISYIIILVISGSCSGLHDSDHGGGGQVSTGRKEGSVNPDDFLGSLAFSRLWSRIRRDFWLLTGGLRNN